MNVFTAESAEVRRGFCGRYEAADLDAGLVAPGLFLGLQRRVVYLAVMEGFFEMLICFFI